jgi:hypothetical protein
LKIHSDLRFSSQYICVIGCQSNIEGMQIVDTYCPYV